MEYIEDSDNNLFGFKLSGYLNSYEFFTKNQWTQKKWIDKLKRICVLFDVSESYSFNELIGKGSFSQVYKAVNKNDKNVYSIKIMDKKLLMENNSNLQSIIDEIKILRMLDHPNIMKLYEVYESQVYVYIVGEYLNGGELLEEIKTRKVYAEKDAAIFMKKLLETLEYLHNKNIAHFDLKPENIILM